MVVGAWRRVRVSLLWCESNFLSLLWVSVTIKLVGAWTFSTWKTTHWRLNVYIYLTRDRIAAASYLLLNRRLAGGLGHHHQKNQKLVPVVVSTIKCCDRSRAHFFSSLLPSPAFETNKINDWRQHSFRWCHLPLTSVQRFLSTRLG